MPTWNSGHHVAHQQGYLARKKAGLVPLPSPWAWLTSADARELILAAYRTATWSARHQGQDTAYISDQEMRQAFLDGLLSDFEDQLRAHAARAGYPFPGLDAVERADAQCAGVPAAWQPQYPQFGRREDRP